jgi:hypothetical protein
LGRSSAEVYHNQARSQYTRKQRQEIFNWLSQHSNAMLETMDNPDHRSIRAAWRIAVETWLRRQELIALSLNGNVLPH